MSKSAIRRYLKHGTLPQLRAFEAVARLGSFTRAATELHMAQPTASIQIRKLTETVGVQLIVQDGRRLRLTSAGRHLYETIEDLFARLAEAESVLAALRTPAGVNSPAGGPQ